MRGRDSKVLAAGLVFVAALVPACSGHDASPTPVVTTSTVALTSPMPATGSTLMPIGTPPGTFFTRGSGQFGVTVTITAGQDLPFAQLAMFLLTPGNADGYCGQNLPDWPTWRPFARGQTVTLTVTGFQVFSLPCEVTGIRAAFTLMQSAPPQFIGSFKNLFSATVVSPNEMRGKLSANLYAYMNPGTGLANLDADGFPSPNPLAPASQCGAMVGCTPLGAFTFVVRRVRIE